MELLREKVWVVKIKYLKYLSSSLLSGRSWLQPWPLWNSPWKATRAAISRLLTWHLPILAKRASSTCSWVQERLKVPRRREKVPVRELLQLTDPAEKHWMVLFYIFPFPGWNSRGGSGGIAQQQGGLLDQRSSCTCLHLEQKPPCWFWLR